jgi:hypothetical protein
MLFSDLEDEDEELLDKKPAENSICSEDSLSKS